jgi:hypothetical protein
LSPQSFPFALVVLMAGLAWLPRESPAAEWTAPSAVTSISLNADVLRDLGLTLGEDRPTGSSPAFPGSAYRSVPPSLLRFRVVAGDFETFDSGSLFHDGGFVLTPDTPGDAISLQGFELRVSSGIDDFHLLDARGRHWLNLRYMQFTAPASGQELLIVNVSLHLARSFAERLGRADLEDVWIGVANLRLPAVVSDALEARALGLGVCDASSDLPIDVSLKDVRSLSQVVREPGGRVALTQATRLENVGQGAVVWGEPIAPPSWGVIDEHPFLAHAVYRLDPDGRLVQLGISDVKHTFRALNEACSCAAGNVLYPGCADSYSPSTNEDRKWLGPRDEINAHDRSWQRVGSHFDQCIGSGTSSLPCDPATHDADDFRDHLGNLADYHDSFDHRLVVPETALQAPGVFFTEAWYLAAGDVTLFNSMAHRVVVPTFEPNTWTFASGLTLERGSILAEIPGATLSLLDTGEGRLQLGVSTTAQGEGQHHYEYALMNFDFDRQIDAFEVPVSPGISVTDTSSIGLGGDPATAWTATRLPNALHFQAPAGDALAWGELASFGFVADAAPGDGKVRLVPRADGDPKSFSLATTTPAPEPEMALLRTTALGMLLALARHRKSTRRRRAD